MKVRFTLSARTQFLGALRYIHRENPSAAIALRRKVETRLRRLERFPDSGRRAPELPDLPYREVVVSPYRFFYRFRARSSGSSRCGTGCKHPTSRNAAQHAVGDAFGGDVIDAQFPASGELD